MLTRLCISHIGARYLQPLFNLTNLRQNLTFSKAMHFKKRKTLPPVRRQRYIAKLTVSDSTQVIQKQSQFQLLRSLTDVHVRK